MNIVIKVYYVLMRFTAYLVLLSLDRSKQAAPPCSLSLCWLLPPWHTRFSTASKAATGGQISAVVNGNQTDVSM